MCKQTGKYMIYINRKVFSLILLESFPQADLNLMIIEKVFSPYLGLWGFKFLNSLVLSSEESVVLYSTVTSFCSSAFRNIIIPKHFSMRMSYRPDSSM